jgi:hypothetical protein
MKLIKYLLFSILSLIVLGISTKHSVDQNYSFGDSSSSEIVYLNDKLENRSIFSQGSTTISNIENNKTNYLDILFRKGNLILMPDYIPILDNSKIEIQADSKKLNVETSEIDFFMLFNSNIFNFSYKSFISHYDHSIFWVILLLLTYNVIIFVIKRFQLSKIITSITLLILALLSSQYINHINNFI